MFYCVYSFTPFSHIFPLAFTVCQASVQFLYDLKYVFHKLFLDSHIFDIFLQIILGFTLFLQMILLF